jgi:thiol-disulfide isomerase/thioredoxin
MNMERTVKVGLALVLVAGVGSYLEHGPRTPRTAAEQGEVLQLLREPRLLPDIGFADSDGRSTRLSSYRGKVVLLNIWATWCVPCRKEMPALDRLQASFRGSDFEVVALSVDRDGLRAVTGFYVQTGIRHLRIYVDESGQAMSDLGVAAIPTTLLIDRHGNEIGRKTGPAEWDNPVIVEVIRDHLDAPAKREDLSGKSPLSSG